MDDVDSLRDKLTDQQGELLSAIWEYYLQNNEWVPCRVLHGRFLDPGKNAVRRMLEELEARIVFVSDEFGKQGYRLTFLGVMLTRKGQGAEELLVKYLEYLRERFLSDPEFDEITSQEVETALHLSAEESGTLNKLLHIGQLFARSASYGEGRWTAGVPSDIDDLPSVRDFRRYVRERAAIVSSPTPPIDQNDQALGFRDPRTAGERVGGFLFDETATTRSVQRLDDLHPEIRSKCRDLYVRGAYGAAVELSFKIVRDRLRSLTGHETGSEAFGRGKLHISGAAAPHVDKDFNEGVKFLTMAIDRFRNEKSHSSDARIDDPIRAYEYLRLSSLAMNLLDNAKVEP